MNRSQRRALDAYVRQTADEWHPFERKTAVEAEFRRFGDVVSCWANNRYSVQVYRRRVSPFGPVFHLNIRRQDDGIDFPWYELQRVKNEIAETRDGRSRSLSEGIGTHRPGELTAHLCAGPRVGISIHDQGQVGLMKRERRTAQARRSRRKTQRERFSMKLHAQKEAQKILRSKRPRVVKLGGST